jgi:hypothetical protein
MMKIPNVPNLCDVTESSMSELTPDLYWKMADELRQNSQSMLSQPESTFDNGE